MSVQGMSSAAESLGPTIGRAVRARREQAGLAQGEFAKLAGVSAGTLSAIEAGSANPTVSTLQALSTVLGCKIGDLLEHGPDPMTRLLRVGDSAWVGGGAYPTRQLHRFTPNGPVELFEMDVNGLDTRVSEPHAEGIYEHVWVVAGAVVAGPSDGTVELQTGDYLCFPGWRSHSYRATEPGTRLLVVLSYTRAQWADRPSLAHSELTPTP